MRIAVNGRFLGARPTGVQRVARRLLEELDGRAELTVYLPAGCGRPALRRAAVVPGTLPGIPWEQLELPARARRDGARLSLDPANAGPRWGGRRVLVLHDVFPVTHPAWYGAWFRAWYRAAVVPAARRAWRVVMFSEWAKGEAVRALGLLPDRVAVITQGVAPFDAPPPAPDVEAALRRLGLRRGYVLAGGAGDPRKNVGFLVAALDRLAERTGRAPELVLTGEPYRHVHGRDDGLAATGRVAIRRLGFVPDEDLRALYAGAGAFCFPSLGEGFGRPPLEAMGCGAPVLAGDYGCAGEVLGAGARILPPAETAWSDAIAELLEDGEPRRSRIAAGRARAAAYRWDRAAEQLLRACAPGPADAPIDDRRPRRSATGAVAS